MYIITNSSLCCFVIPVVSAITGNSRRTQVTVLLSGYVHVSMDTTGITLPPYWDKDEC